MGLAVPGFLLAERFHPFFPNLPGDEESIFASQDTWETARDRPLLVAFLLGVAAFESLSFKNYEEPTSLSPWRAPEQNSGGRSGAMRADIVPGATFPRGPWTADKLSPEEFVAKQNTELNNGRLAMISMVFLVAQEFFTGLPVEIWTSMLSVASFSLLQATIATVPKNLRIGAIIELTSDTTEQQRAWLKPKW